MVNTERKPHSWEEILKKIRNKKVVIFGADIVGKLTHMLLKEAGIEIQNYIDNNKNKVRKKIASKQVIDAKIWLKENNQDTIIIIASTYIEDIIYQLEEMGYLNWVPIFQLLIDQKQKKFLDYFDESLKYNHTGGKFTDDFILFAVDNMINSQMKYFKEDYVFMRSVDFVITEKCSLKCKDCCNLMQFYEKPENIDKIQLFEELDMLLTVVDELNELRVIGGDPLMNKHCYETVQKASSYSKINKVVVYTNGVICPKENDLLKLKNPKSFVFITTYGDLSKNASKLANMCEKYGINYNIQPAYGWTDCGEVKDYQRNENELKKLFRFCCAKNFITMTDGKVYRCPFAANADRLKATPNDKRNYVSLKEITNEKITPKSRKKILLHYLRNIEFLPACNTCNGRTYGDNEIIPGIQSKDVIPYKKYEHA